MLLADNCCEELLSLFTNNQAIETVILDIGSKDRNICIDEVNNYLRESKHTEQTLLVLVWAYGQEPCYINTLIDLKERYGILVMEDRCLAIPVLPEKIHDTNVCADAIVFSTGYSKYCDLHYGGWLYDFTLGAIDINLCNIDQKIYFKSISDRLSLVQEHKNRINELLLPAVHFIQSSQWLSTTWRLSFETDKPNLLKKIVFENGIFCSTHYNYFTQISTMDNNSAQLKRTLAHKNKVINIFNDLRVNHDYCGKIIDSISIYIDALRDTC